MKKIGLLALIIPFLGACSSIQNVEPASGHSGEKLCIVDNPAVRDGFLTAYSNAVTARGYQVLVVPANSATSACSFTSTYVANWNWDLAMYMRYAQINIYRDGALDGSAVYDAHTAGTSKFINADAKIQELVGLLLPAQ